MIDHRNVCLFIPPKLQRFKLALFERIGEKIIAAGGRIIRHDFSLVERLENECVPIVGCSPEFRKMVLYDWPARNRKFVYWDRGYLRRVFATWLPTGAQLGVPMGFYRWTINAFQMKYVKDVPNDRWKRLKLDDHVRPWNRNGNHIVLAAAGGTDYDDLFSDRQWTDRTYQKLRATTNRKIVIRNKESKTPLYEDLKDAHCLVTHGSIAAVEAVVMGCPVFVHEFSAARHVGSTDLSAIEHPVCPERQPWLNSLAASQWTETGLVDGTLWREIW